MNLLCSILAEDTGVESCAEMKNTGTGAILEDEKDMAVPLWL